MVRGGDSSPRTKKLVWFPWQSRGCGPRAGCGEGHKVPGDPGSRQCMYSSTRRVVALMMVAACTKIFRLHVRLGCRSWFRSYPVTGGGLDESQPTVGGKWSRYSMYIHTLGEDGRNGSSTRMGLQGWDGRAFQPLQATAKPGPKRCGMWIASLQVGGLSVCHSWIAGIVNTLRSASLCQASRTGNKEMRATL
jgi:hypothetical protein